MLLLTFLSPSYSVRILFQGISLRPMDVCFIIDNWNIIHYFIKLLFYYPNTQKFIYRKITVPDTFLKKLSMRRKSERNNKIFNTKAMIALSLFFILVNGFSFGQSATWQRILNYNYGGVTKVLQTPDGGFAAVGSVRINNEWKINLTKLDRFGNILWVKIFGIGYAEARWAENTNDNGFIIGGFSDSSVGNSKIYIIKTDSTGNIHWQRYFSNSSLDQCNCIKQTNDGGFIAVCRTEPNLNSEILIIKLNSGGVLLWQKNYRNNTKGLYLSEIELKNNGYFAVGSIFITNNPVSENVLLMNLSLLGDTIWTKEYGGINYDNGYSIEYFNNKLIICGVTDSYNNHSETLLINADSSGNILWQNSYSGTYMEECSTVKYKTGVGFILAGYADTTNIMHTRALIKVIDSNGVLKRQKTYFPLNRGGWFNDMELADDGGYILGGKADTNSYDRMYVVKTDSNLFAEPIGIIKINDKIPLDFKVYPNYPNPFNPETNIKFDIPKDVNVTIKIYDILGKEVFSFNEYQKAGSYEIMFDGTNLASGMYIYKLVVGDASLNTNNGVLFTDTKKMVLLK